MVRTATRKGRMANPWKGVRVWPHEYMIRSDRVVVGDYVQVIKGQDGLRRIEDIDSLDDGRVIVRCMPVAE